MTANKFIDGFKLANNKDEYVRKHIVTDYINYESKVTEAQEICNQTMYKEVDGKKIFWVNSTNQYLCFVIRLIVLYTDIELGEGTDVLKNFNLLNSKGLIDIICSSIPETEYIEFQRILAMVADDEIQNIRSIPSYLDTKIESLSIISDLLLQTMVEQDN